MNRQAILGRLYTWSLGFITGLLLSGIVYAQLYPGMSPEQRDMTMERYWRGQQFYNQQQEQERFQDSFDWRKPC